MEITKRDGERSEEIERDKERERRPLERAEQGVEGDRKRKLISL